MDVALPEGFVSVDVPVPPELATLVGYEGPARWLALWWEFAGDEVAWSDGRRQVIGANWVAFVAWADHQRVTENLPAYSFFHRGLDGVPDESLLLDREKLRIYRAPAAAAAKWVVDQWPPVVDLTGFLAGLDAAARAGAEAAARLTVSGVRQRHAAEHAAIKEMVAWLDEH